MRFNLFRSKAKLTKKEITMTELQLNFIRRACHEYGVAILEELFGVPDELSDIPDWARSEINDLVEMLDKASSQG